METVSKNVEIKNFVDDVGSVENTDLSRLIPNTSFSSATGLQWNSYDVGNFNPILLNVEKVTTNGETELHARVKCEFTDGKYSNEESISLSDLDSFKWHDFDVRCRINPDCTKANKYLASIIRAQIPSATTVDKQVITRTGMHFINDKPLYCVGDRAILSPDIGRSINIEVDTAGSRMVIDDDLSEKQAVAGMMRIVNVSPEAGRVIFAQCLLGIMRSAYKDAGAIPKGVLFLVGDSGIHKTVYASFATQLYDRDGGIKEPRRTNSSIPALETIMNNNHDCVVVVDDLFPTKDRSSERDQEKLLIELVRIVGDNVGRALVRGNEVVTKDPNCGVIIAGEYLIGTGSSAARLLPIIFSEKIDGIKLMECQSEPLVLSTFYHYFITWYVDNYFQIRNWLAKELIQSRQSSMGIHDRLKETYFHLNTAYKIFIQYCLEKRFTHPTTARTLHKSYIEHLTYLVMQQEKRVRMSNDGKSDEIDYLGIIRALYKDDVFRLAKSQQEFKEHKHHGLIYNDCLCLRGEKLIEEMNKYGVVAKIDNVADHLERRDSLKRVNDKRTIQIPTPKNNFRYYVIPLKKLK